jgi:hypothetical protein
MPKGISIRGRDFGNDNRRNFFEKRGSFRCSIFDMGYCGCRNRELGFSLVSANAVETSGDNDEIPSRPILAEKDLRSRSC